MGSMQANMQADALARLLLADGTVASGLGIRDNCGLKVIDGMQYTFCAKLSPILSGLLLAFLIESKSVQLTDKLVHLDDLLELFWQQRISLVFPLLQVSCLA